MNRFSKESKISLTGTILFHGLLILICLFSSLGSKPKNPDYVELSFTAIEQPKEEEVTIPEVEETVAKMNPVRKEIIKTGSSRPAVSAAAVSSNSKSASSAVKTGAPKISPPRYNLTIDDQSQPLRYSDSKIDVADSRNVSSLSGKNISEIGSDKGNFSRNNSSEKLSGGNSSISSGVSSPGNSNVGKEIKGYSISWRDGGNRSKISGSLPRYPDNSNKEVQIKVKITVTPEGIVSQIVPLQKADYTFENAVATALKTWKFEKLKTGQPRESQTGIITFNFKFD